VLPAWLSEDPYEREAIAFMVAVIASLIGDLGRASNVAKLQGQDDASKVYNGAVR